MNAYLVCAVQRTGSGFLIETLKSTGVAGVPEEYFLMFEEGWWAQDHGAKTRQEYLDLVFRKGTTANGVFGAKLMWNTFQDPFQTKISELDEFTNLSDVDMLNTLFNQPKFVWNTRRDKVSQAVSWTIAAQTGIYSSAQGEPDEPAVFDFEQIDLLHRLANEWEERWADFFQRANVTPFKIVYEDFMANFEETAVTLMDYLEIELPTGFQFTKPTKIKKQATARNSEWAERYLEMKQEKSA